MARKNPFAWELHSGSFNLDYGTPYPPEITEILNGFRIKYRRVVHEIVLLKTSEEEVEQMKTLVAAILKRDKLAEIEKIDKEIEKLKTIQNQIELSLNV